MCTADALEWPEELQKLAAIVDHWHEFYAGGGDLGDYADMLDNVLRPYVERLLAIGTITVQQRTDFLAMAFERLAMLEARNEEGASQM